MQEILRPWSRVISPRAVVAPNSCRLVGGPMQPPMCGGIPTRQRRPKGNSTDILTAIEVTVWTNVPYFRKYNNPNKSR